MDLFPFRAENLDTRNLNTVQSCALLDMIFHFHRFHCLIGCDFLLILKMRVFRCVVGASDHRRERTCV
jgi:hypothetical protein